MIVLSNLHSMLLVLKNIAAVVGHCYSSHNISLFSPGTFQGVCKDIDHFAEDADYEQDAAEYLLRM